MLPLLAAALPAIGDVIGGLFSQSGQESANEANERIAQQNRDFQERMSSSAWQRGVADMRAAGINPMLSFMQGPASSPAGATATMQNPNAGLGSSIEQGVSSAMGAIQLQKVLQQQDAQIENTRAQSVNVQTDTLKRQLEYSLLAAKDSPQLQSMMERQMRAQLLNMASQSASNFASARSAGVSADIRGPLGEAAQTALRGWRGIAAGLGSVFDRESDAIAQGWNLGRRFVQSLPGGH